MRKWIADNSDILFLLAVIAGGIFALLVAVKIFWPENYNTYWGHGQMATQIYELRQDMSNVMTMISDNR